MASRPSGQGLGFDAESSKRANDEIIDLGLERLYRRGLERGVKSVKGIWSICQYLRFLLAGSLRRYWSILPQKIQS